MKIKAKIDYKNITASGKPRIEFFCEDCGLSYAGHGLVSYFWNSPFPKQDIEKAMADFLVMLNTQQTYAFHLNPQKNPWKKLFDKLCHCDPDVIDIERIKSIKRAQSILAAGLKQIRMGKE